VVRTRPHTAAPGEDVLVFERRGGDARALCDADAGGARFGVADPDRSGFYFGIVGNHLLLDEGTGPNGRTLRGVDLTSERVLDEGTGPNGRTLRVVDLTSERVLHEAGYEEPVEVRDGALLYGMAPEVVETMEEVRALGVDCPEAEEWLGGGLAVGLSPQVRYD